VALNKTRTAVRNELLWCSVDSILPIKVDPKEIKKMRIKMHIVIVIEIVYVKF
jgi:hypothetical protein